jgi:ATP-dependent DNA helicase RecG
MHHPIQRAIDCLPSTALRRTERVMYSWFLLLLITPQSEVVCIRYGDRLGVGKYVNRQNLTGTLPELIDKTAEFLKLYIQVGAEIVEFKRIDKPEYPLEALREAVVNAVVHRDYSLEGETIRIFFYTDRVDS